MNKREFKFQVWDGIEKRMIPWREIIESSTRDEWFLACLEGLFPEHTVLQSLGRKDKNGNDIYEGYFLFCDNYPMDGCCQVIWRNEDSRFVFKFNSLIDHDLDVENYEIVGNIFEDPEIISGSVEIDRLIKSYEKDPEAKEALDIEHLIGIYKDEPRAQEALEAGIEWVRDIYGDIE